MSYSVDLSVCSALASWCVGLGEGAMLFGKNSMVDERGGVSNLPSVHNSSCFRRIYAVSFFPSSRDMRYE